MKQTKLLVAILIVASLIIFSCSEDSVGPDNEGPNIPSNPNPADTATSILTNANLNWDCSDPENDPLTYDVYFGATSNPPLANTGQSETIYNPGTLDDETTYYWKIVAHDDHSNSTTGNVWQFTTNGEVTGTVTDIDGNVYQTLVIGNQEWMIENLKVTHYRNGDLIPNVTDNNQWLNLLTGAYCFWLNDSSYVETYGNLYNWFAVDDSRNIAPDGWHVPTDEEIQVLEIYLGMSQSSSNINGWRGTNEGSKLAGRADLWYDGALVNDPEFDSSGFSFLPGGQRSGNDNFCEMVVYGPFLSSTAYDNDRAWFRLLSFNLSSIYRHTGSKHSGFSVRCVKDQ